MAKPRPGDANMDLNVNEVSLSIAAVVADATRRWFAAYTSSRHEKRVAEHLAMRDVEVFLPLYAAMHRWNNGCKVKVELPLFPGYIFVRIQRQERVRVLEAPGVLSLVGRGSVPSSLPDLEIEALRASLHLRKLEPHPYLVVGERVRIKYGPAAGIEGVLLRKKNNFRVVLTLTNVMRSVAVEVDADEVEPLGRQRPQPSIS